MGIPRERGTKDTHSHGAKVTLLNIVCQSKSTGKIDLLGVLIFLIRTRFKESHH